MSSEAYSRALMSLAVACAIVSTGFVARRELFGSGSGALKPREVSGWQSYVDPSAVIGDLDAPIKLIVFSDFQCPFCKDFAENVWPPIHERFGDSVALAVRHWPLVRLHRHAYDAARAATCAGDQGAFEAFHDRLYEHQAEIGVRSYLDLASESGVADLARFAECVSSEDLVPTIDAGETDALSLGLRGTPSIMINDLLLYSPPPPLDELVGYIEERLNQRPTA